MLDKKYHENEAPNLNALLQAYPQFVESKSMERKINKQWSALCDTDFPEDIKKEKKIDDFWIKLEEYQDDKLDNRFQSLCNFVYLILLLPNSNAKFQFKCQTYLE